MHDEKETRSSQGKHDETETRSGVWSLRSRAQGLGECMMKRRLGLRVCVKGPESSGMHDERIPGLGSRVSGLGPGKHVESETRSGVWSLGSSAQGLWECTMKQRLETKSRVWSPGSRAQGPVECTMKHIPGPGSRVLGPGSRVEGLGSTIKVRLGSESGVQLGPRVQWNAR
eukprot:1851472-Rhodomonas_salina.3